MDAEWVGYGQETYGIFVDVGLEVLHCRDGT